MNLTGGVYFVSNSVNAVTETGAVYVVSVRVDSSEMNEIATRGFAWGLSAGLTIVLILTALHWLRRVGNSVGRIPRGRR